MIAARLLPPTAADLPAEPAGPGPLPAADLPLLLSVAQMAALTGIAVRTIWRMTSSGDFPQPRRIGRRTWWRRRDVEAWVDALEAAR